MDVDNHSNLSSEQEGICHSTNNKSLIKEFIPASNHDPSLAELRHLFVSSFYEYYKTIEQQLNLPKDETLQHWLELTFDEEIEEVLFRKCHCFLIFALPSSSTIAGFLTTKKSKNDPTGIYISQCTIDPIFKRKGYGLLLLKNLKSIFPSATSYTCLCRRVNKPALNFYKKCGATLHNDDDIATQYGYNPIDYLGFQFTNNQL